MADAACTMGCGATVPDARVATGKTHCTGQQCVAAWIRQRQADKGLVLVLPHKQGLTWTTRDQVPDYDMRRAGGGQR